MGRATRCVGFQDVADLWLSREVREASKFRGCTKHQMMSTARRTYGFRTSKLLQGGIVKRQSVQMHRPAGKRLHFRLHQRSDRR